MEVLYLTHPLFREHDPGYGHPERRERLDAIEAGLGRTGVLPRLKREGFEPAPLPALARVHRKEYLEFVLSTRGRRFVFDADTHTSEKSVDAALLASGACLKAMELVLARPGALTAFCAVRPPGHHAESQRAMGFCLFNHVAVAAASALEEQGLKRVMILDPDLHHGNGTQEIFYDSPRVLYISTHRYPFYPGTGSVEEYGTGLGEGYTLNFPLPGGSGDQEFLYIMRNAILPALEHFSPELLIISAGFDAHERDPLGDLALTTEGFRYFYAPLFQRCLEKGIPFFLVLEGGYDLKALEETVPLLLQDLLKERFPTPSGHPSPPPWLEELVGLQYQRITRYLGRSF